MRGRAISCASRAKKQGKTEMVRRTQSARTPSLRSVEVRSASTASRDSCCRVARPREVHLPMPVRANIS
eukprot:2958371-Pleurochrysis_carterae.AAC.2